ncbi:unnamed protein product [Withania somnifera]
MLPGFSKGISPLVQILQNALLLEHPSSLLKRLLDKHNRELEHLNLTNQPLKTVKFFTLAVLKYLHQFSVNTIKCSCLVVTLLAAAGGILLLTHGRSYQETLQPIQEILSYLRFGLWWLALGVASSIGLGSGLHTFVLYLGPHIALFTIKSVSCGRVDIKNAPYDTIQLRSGPSWLDKDCSEFGPSLFSLPGARIPLTSLLNQVQLEAILWGIGTALGELPPYFISRAAFIISVCNNQLLDLIENQFVWVLSLIPGFASFLPNIISKLHIAREKYMTASPSVSSVKAKKWDLSLGSLWNTVVWLMLLNFSVKIVNTTAKGYLREQQEKELSALENIRAGQ